VKKYGIEIKMLKQTFFNWNISDEELDNQVKNYDSLKITESYRGQSVLLIGFILTLTVITVFFKMVSLTDAWFDVLLFIVFALFIYQGKRWAIISAIILYTIEKGYGFYLKPEIMHIIWWLIVIPVFYRTLLVENKRIKLSKHVKKTIRSIKVTCPKCGEIIAILKPQETVLITCPKCNHSFEQSPDKLYKNKIVETKEIKWFHRPWNVILTSIIFPVLGIFFLWNTPLYKRWIKIFATVLLVFFTFFHIGFVSHLFQYKVTSPSAISEVFFKNKEKIFLPITEYENVYYYDWEALGIKKGTFTIKQIYSYYCVFSRKYPPNAG